MSSSARVPGQPPHRALIITGIVVPLTGWTVHAVTLHRRLREDPLTGLLNRDGYTARAQKIARRHPVTGLVLLIDVDHFKTINDTRGHAVGDRVLAVTARRLAAWTGNRGVAGRLGGDEFAAALQVTPSRRLAAWTS
ncbi:GGDEF domain-containing protein [Streptomyces sp. NBC_01525]|uniref:GGDEF domain-containing protein n=1 Tax=Streptomyces sp. NBC_01525 TaxID=2903893 RepID=UPI002F9139C1